MGKSIIVIIFVLVIAGVGILVMGRSNDDAKPDAEETSENQNQEQPLVNAVPAPGSEDVDEMVVDGQNETVSAVVTYVDGGFDPKIIGPITPGSTVRFINESTSNVWVASADHPTHTKLPGFDSGPSISPGEEYLFTFESAGIWQYHNHFISSESGSVQVTQE